MRVVTAEQMHALDRRAIEERGIPGAVLMENAGKAVVDVVAHIYGPLHGKRIAVFCGAGNNGGDGFVVARHLHLEGAKPTLFMVGDSGALKGEARLHYDLACQLAMPYIDGGNDPAALERDLTAFDLIVDALLGTGIKKAPRGSYATAIERINRSGRPVIAVDLPSGLDADTGATPGAVIAAAHTVTFAYPKTGLFLFPGAERVGTLHIDPIGFDWETLAPQTSYRLLTPETFRGLRLLRTRPPESNKGDYGHVGVIAGSRGMAGAPAMVARAAQRAGAGLVTVLAPTSVQPMIAAKLDEQMTIPLPDAAGAIAEDAFDAIARFAEKATVLCIGPGLTTEPGAVALVRRLLIELPKPTVLDADGLNALALDPTVIEKRPENIRAPLILTPHPGEAARLLGTSISAIQSNRLASAVDLARRFRAVAVLKGRHTLIADPAGNVAINTTGNPGMATGGMGDTLTGILGGLLAQGVAPGKDAHEDPAYLEATVPPQDVAALGVYLHGRAGDLAAAAHGETGLIAGDLTERLPMALRLLEGEL